MIYTWGFVALCGYLLFGVIVCEWVDRNDGRLHQWVAGLAGWWNLFIFAWPLWCWDAAALQREERRISKLQHDNEILNERLWMIAERKFQEHQTSEQADKTKEAI